MSQADQELRFELSQLMQNATLGHTVPHDYVVTNSQLMDLIERIQILEMRERHEEE